MAKDKTPTQQGAVLKKPSVAKSPVHGAATRWLLRIRRKRLLRCLILSKIKGNKPLRCRAQRAQLELQPQVDNGHSWYWLLLLFCVAMGLCRERYTNSMAPSSFEVANYCDRSHRLGEMVTHVRQQVPHQEEALEQLERALDNVTFQTIALVGSSGVGKSHTARTLRTHFPWPENVKTLSWRESPSLLRVQSMLTNIFRCGQNLILIDDLRPLDGHLVPIFNELIRGRDEIAKGSSDQPDLKQLTSIFMFTVDRQQPQEIFEAEMESLKQLPSTHVIIYADLETSSKSVGGEEELQQVAVRASGSKSNGANKALTEEEEFSSIAVSFKFLN